MRSSAGPGLPQDLPAASGGGAAPAPRESGKPRSGAETPPRTFSVVPEAPPVVHPMEETPAPWSEEDGPEPKQVLLTLQRALGQSVIGYEDVVRALTLALVADGHVLLEGVPGLAKTYLVRAFARTLDLSFKRIQFTPDMLPSDILGTVTLDPKTQAFEFRKGPIFAHVVLADEINRAPPKVQSALLEAMQERQVTVEGRSYPLPRPFVVIATENPVEQEGTYPLPEAELDRFLFRLLLGYPSENDELVMMRTRAEGTDADPPPGIWGPKELQHFHAMARRVFVSHDLLRYMTALVRETRRDPRILVGASPRAGVQFLHATKAAALFAGRKYVIPDDAKGLAFPALNHRLVLHPEVLAQQYSQGPHGDTRVLHEVVRSLVERVAVPR
jgi:MoxR-like ATPase